MVGPKGVGGGGLVYTTITNILVKINYFKYKYQLYYIEDISVWVKRTAGRSLTTW